MNSCSRDSRRVTFDEHCYRPAPSPAVPVAPISIPSEITEGGYSYQSFDRIGPQNARHQPFQLGSSVLTVEHLSRNGARPPLTRQYVDDPTTDPNNHFWQAISQQPGQQYGRAKLEEVIRQGELMRPERTMSREPWQRMASQTRLRPPAKMSGIVTERSRYGYDDDTIYALGSNSGYEFPDCSGNPADLNRLWKSPIRQPHEAPKRVFEKKLIERYPEVYGNNGVPSPIISGDCPPPPHLSNYKPFPDNSIAPDPRLRPWSARA